LPFSCPPILIAALCDLSPGFWGGDSFASGWLPPCALWVQLSLLVLDRQRCSSSFLTSKTLLAPLACDCLYLATVPLSVDAIENMSLASGISAEYRDSFYLLGSTLVLIVPVPVHMR
jgi:hypothetical protein